MSSDKFIKSGREHWCPLVILLITFCFIAWLAYLNIKFNAIKGDRGPPGKDGLPGSRGDIGTQGPAAQTQTNDSAAFIDTSLQGKISYNFSEVSNTVVFNFINRTNIGPGASFDMATIKIPNFTLPLKNNSIIGTCFAHDKGIQGQLDFSAKITAILQADETGVATISILNAEKLSSSVNLPIGMYVFGTINWVAL